MNFVDSTFHRQKILRTEKILHRQIISETEFFFQRQSKVWLILYNKYVNFIL